MGDNPQKEMKQLFQSGLRKLNISLDGIALEKLLLYAGELEKWSRRINLIARKTTTRDVVEKHFLDSLTLLPFVVGKDNLPSATLLDVGTGAGFPGLVLAVALPDLQVILVEPRLKRVSFLRHIIRTLSLANVEIIDQRLESAPGLQEKKIDYVTSRAVAEPAVFLPMVMPFLDGGARVLLMLGPDHAAQWKGDGPLRQLQLEESRDFVLPFSGAERTLCKLEHKK